MRTAVAESHYFWPDNDAASRRMGLGQAELDPLIPADLIPDLTPLVDKPTGTILPDSTLDPSLVVMPSDDAVVYAPPMTVDGEPVYYTMQTTSLPPMLPAPGTAPDLSNVVDQLLRSISNVFTSPSPTETAGQTTSGAFGMNPATLLIIGGVIYLAFRGGKRYARRRKIGKRLRDR